MTTTKKRAMKAAPKSTAAARRAAEAAKASRTEARQRERLRTALAARFPGYVESSVRVIADELYRSVRSAVYAVVPGRQRATHLAPAMAKAVKAAVDGMRKRATGGH